MTRPGVRHPRCGGVWRGPLHDDTGTWLVCNTCGEQTPAEPLENGAVPMNTCTHRICRTTAPCRYGNPTAGETQHPQPRPLPTR